ncbi:uncharacterized protein LOC141586044 [Silene latifolia]|uniref:uncharacterized protein LOC141586044 n=1 Tax=Silene latifolia TaxID=37657 RepID=UPI003D782E42
MQGPHSPVQWYKSIWDNWNVPKHSFIGWLIQHEALNTWAKLFQWGLCETTNCVLCEHGEESHDHLFKDCLYSAQILAGIEQWLQLSLDGSGNYSKLQRKVCRMAKLACWYIIWHEGNPCRIEMKLRRPVQILRELQMMLHSRILQKMEKHACLESR